MNLFRGYVILGVFVFVSAFPSAVAQAGMYSWKDDNGKMHVTDGLYKIPEKYRKDDKGFKKYRSARPPSSPLPLLKKPVRSSYSPSGLRGREYVIPLIPTPSGNFLAEVVFNNRVKALLMVDTGASLVTISDKLAKRLGYRTNSKSAQIPFTTAGGMVWMPMLALDTVKVGQAQVDLVEASVNDQLGDIDGLLGMSFLGDYRVEMDTSRSQMILRPLGNPGDQKWGGKSALWWKSRYSGYANKIKDFKWEAKRMDATGHPKAANIRKMVAFYKDLHHKLDLKASRAGVPTMLRTTP